ncbi:MAG: exodeoxyribonuclease III [Deltaproteobacteria bacterium]|nr:MAG: exodeoxyribonuclease III [Deltaproteobacteria bacterium]RLC14410.1 MAG: exodeoxyribonuclease III [Deltaproteobacteria bacterium]HHE73498.1 exodeoxyribonuclease III [Desulfobacteraceae bacterium]
MRIISWNVNGIRAAVKKGFTESLEAMQPDMLCLQETKAQDDQVAEALAGIQGYRLYANSAVKKGYAGTAVLSKKEPLSVRLDMGIEQHDQEGRIIALEFDQYFLVTVYTPNSGSELKRLEYRRHWDAAFLDYLEDLQKAKPVVVCGDFNVAHKPIDLARPKPNYNKSAGYMQAEIDGMDNIVAANFVDTYRFKNPDKIKYSWWSYRAAARKRNIGWRIDYLLVSPGLAGFIRNSDILNDIMGSDHCPILLDME